MVRIHQEDLCQASGKYPSQKYQVDGGPSAVDVLKILDSFSDNSREDIDRFVCALALNWIIGGTDAHSKNYSIMHSRNSFLRLAPIYDLASWLPYERDQNSSKTKLAMKIGGTYRLHQINAIRWKKLELEAGISMGMGTGWVMSAYVSVIAGRIIEEVEAAYEEVANAMGDSSFLRKKLTGLIRARAEKCFAEMS